MPFSASNTSSLLLCSPSHLVCNVSGRSKSYQFSPVDGVEHALLNGCTLRLRCACLCSLLKMNRNRMRSTRRKLNIPNTWSYNSRESFQLFGNYRVRVYSSQLAEAHCRHAMFKSWLLAKYAREICVDDFMVELHFLSTTSAIENQICYMAPYKTEAVACRLYQHYLYISKEQPSYKQQFGLWSHPNLPA
jgi:hypothetical protein